MIYLFLLCFSVNLISANPLAKFLLQTRKNNNQNGFNNFNVPIPTNNVQPYAPPNMIQNPTTNGPCNQPYLTQNGFPVQINVEDINQSYLNKLLANPMLQNILNPNANNFNQNKKDFAVQANHGQTPNIINNYYIIPPEYLQGGENGAEIIKNLIENQAITGQNEHSLNQKIPENKRRMQRPQNEPNEEVRRPKGNKKARNEEGSTNNTNNNRRRRRKKTGSQDNRHQQNKPEQNMNRSSSSTKQINDKVNDEINLSRTQTNAKNISPQSPEKNGKKKRKRPRNKSGDTSHVSKVINNVDTVMNNNDTVTTEIVNEQKPKEKRTQSEVSRNYTDEDVIRDIHYKFPGIPKNVIRRLLRHLRRQLQKQQLHDYNNAKCKTNNREHGNNRKSQNKRRKYKNNSTNLIEVSETSLPTTTTIVPILITTTKEVLTTHKENTTKYIDSTEKEHTTEYKIATEVIETTDTDVQMPKLGEEYEIENLENNVDDYFPDFRFDKMYMSEDEYIRSLRDNKLYYTTDRNYEKRQQNEKDESSEIYYKPFELTKNVKKPYNNQFQSQEIEDTLIRPMKDSLGENYDKEIITDYSPEEIQFQIPPILEYPDFETKPVIKYYDLEHPIYTKQEYKNKDNVSEKSSNYSDVKNVNTSLKNKPMNDNIETVYAGSKVAKYGTPQDVEEDVREKEKDDETIVVYARTMSDS